MFTNKTFDIFSSENRHVIIVWPLYTAIMSQELVLWLLAHFEHHFLYLLVQELTFSVKCQIVKVLSYTSPITCLLNLYFCSAFLFLVSLSVCVFQLSVSWLSADLPRLWANQLSSAHFHSLICIFLIISCQTSHEFCSLIYFHYHRCQYYPLL